jgi:hypothetical protein
LVVRAKVGDLLAGTDLYFLLLLALAVLPAGWLGPIHAAERASALFAEGRRGGEMFVRFSARCDGGHA